jgi:hypothetical protein
MASAAEVIGEYLTAELAPAQPESGKTKRWILRNRRSGFPLGVIEWRGMWRQYVFAANIEEETVHSAGCLRDIAAFIERANKEQRAR